MRQPRSAEYHRAYRRSYRHWRHCLSGVWVDNSTHNAVVARAARDHTTVAEAYRTLIEWGLEADAQPKS